MWRCRKQGGNEEVEGKRREEMREKGIEWRCR